MAPTDNLTTLVCLFHHQDQASAAMRDLLNAGVSQSSISLIGNYGSEASGQQSAALEELGVPERDQQHLLDGIKNGGTIIAVTATSDHAGKVEDIFESRSAEKIDEVDGGDRSPEAPLAAAALPLAAEDAAAIPIVEEELLVGKRSVDRGGVRVYRRLIEIPVEETVALHQEHVTIERRPVDRAVTETDLALQGNRTIELTETAEEAVVSKNARVVEEVLIGKELTEHTETIHDTVRRTEVQIEHISSDTPELKQTF